ncbi:MAG: DoxX family membrane protein [Gemmatimonadales bacterium]
MTDLSARRSIGRCYLAAGMIALGIVTLRAGSYVLRRQSVPAPFAGESWPAYLSALIALAGGIGLVVRRSALAASGVVLAYAVFWLVVLKLPPIITHAGTEGYWESAAEVAVIAAGAWQIFRSMRSRDVAAGNWHDRLPALLCGIALIPIGLSHFVYLKDSIGFVPAWLPARRIWAIVAGAGHLAAGVALITGIVPRLAARLEAVMLTLFALLVWLPGVIATNGGGAWTEMVITALVAAGAWAVGDGVR